MSEHRQPWITRALSRLIIGDDAETLRGDLEESYHARVRLYGKGLRTHAEHAIDVIASLGHWWWAASLRAFKKLTVAHPNNLPDQLGGEMRQLIRQLVRRPAHSAIVVLTLALGIGATTTVYTVVDVLLVRPLPYRDAERLVVIGNTNPTRRNTPEREGLVTLEAMSLPNVNLLIGRTHVVDQVATVERTGWISADQATGTTELIEIAAASENMLSMLSAKPIMGRLLQFGDAPVGSTQPWNTVITYDTWQRKFGGDPNVIGRTSAHNLLKVVGVLPRDFQPPAALVGSDVEYWILLNPDDDRYRAPRRRNLHVLARLAPNVSIEQAQRELARAQVQVARELPEGNRLQGGLTLGVAVNSLRDETIGSAGRPAMLVLGAAMLLLLLSCSNASNLLLVRGLERAGEMAVRQAIGAGRARLTAGLVGESLVLSLAGGVVGLALAAIGIGLFRRFGPASIPMIANVTMDTRVAFAGVALSILVGFLVGVVPAIRGGTVDLLSSLRSSASVLTHSRSRLRNALAATQLALALVLGVGATLLFRSFVKVASENLGFQPARLVVFNLPLKVPNYVEAWDNVIANVRAVPGVSSVAIASDLPFSTPTWMPHVQLAEQTNELSTAGIPGYIVTPTFFSTAGIQLMRGRVFDQTDRAESGKVAIVNRSFAASVLANRNPIGARLKIAQADARGLRLNEAMEVEVVGVVDDVVQARIEDGISPAIYVPYTQMPAMPNVVVATGRAMSPEALTPDLKRAIAAAGYPEFPMMNLGSMSGRIAKTRVAPRFHAMLIGAFALTAILLAAIGLYGTLAFAVRSRKKELGIRIALGAAPEQIHRMVIGQGAGIFAVGGVVGVIGALAVTRVMQGFLYRMSAIDPLSFVMAVVGLGVIVLLAALGPALRAGRIDPMTSIRAEG